MAPSSSSPSSSSLSSPPAPCSSPPASLAALPRAFDSPPPNSRRGSKTRLRAIRLSRETQIPALALHCPQFPASSTDSQFNAESRLRGTLQSLFEHEGVSMGTSSVSSSCYDQSPDPAGAYRDGRLNRNSEWQGCPVEVSYSECSGGDGDISEMGNSDGGFELFELRHWREGSSSPLSNYEAPINVTRAASECSSEAEEDKVVILNSSLRQQEEDWSVDDWKLQAEVLMAECNLLRVEKELALRRWRRSYTCMNKKAFIGQTPPSMPVEEDDSYDDLMWQESPLPHQFVHSDCWKEDEQMTLSHSKIYSSGSFAKEALRRLQSFSNTGYGTVPQDATDALQERLQKLLLAAQSSLKGSDHVISQQKLYDKLETSELESSFITLEDRKKPVSKNSPDEKRCLLETAALCKQLDLLHSELSETKEAAAYVRKEYRSMLSGESNVLLDEQASNEEMFCKVAIRRIAAQVQAEAEQWSQVQEILHNLQEEMEDLNRAREMWEERALRAEAQLLSLREMVHESRCQAQNAEEEVALLQSERQALKNKIRRMKHRHAAERSRWVAYEGSNLKEKGAGTLSAGVEQNKCSVCEVEEKPRHASVGTQEDYALCESIVHSRNESSRSSFDMGSTSAYRSSCIINTKKSLDFAMSNSDGATKARLKNHRLGDQLSKFEPGRLDFCSKSDDVNGSARHKAHKPNNPPVCRLEKLEIIEPNMGGNESKERKKARHFSSKENWPSANRNSSQGISMGVNQLQGKMMDAHSGPLQHSLKSMPASGPVLASSRLPFGDAMNRAASPIPR